MDVAVVANPSAGKGRGGRVLDAALDRLAERGASVRRLVGRDADEAVALCHGAVDSGVEALIALGGDGMVHMALGAVAGTEVALGVIPAGTGNDLATHLGMPTDPVAAVDVVLGATPWQMDAVRVGERWFGCILGAGFDSVVNERANRMRWPRGAQRYNLAIAAELPRFRARPFELLLDGEPWRTEAMLVAVANARSYGAGMRITPDARLDDGLLDVCVLGPVSKPDFVRTFPKVFKGEHLSHPAVTIKRARVVELSSPGLVAYADGERFGELPLTCECVPGAVRVLAPPPAA